MRVLLSVLIVLAFVLGLVWLLQRRLIYFPSTAVPDRESVLPEAEDVAIATDDGLALAGWFVPGGSGVSVVVFSGNAGNRGDRTELARSFATSGYNVLLFDYRGYGGNPGSPTEDGLLIDGAAAVRYLESRSEVDPARIVYFGESLGAGVAIAVAGDRSPAALVLRSPFTSLVDVGSKHYPFLPLGLMLWDRYPNIERIGQVQAPVLVVAGTEDGTIPVEQSRDVFDASPEPSQWLVIEGADHNDAALSHGPAVIDAVIGFLGEWVS